MDLVIDVVTGAARRVVSRSPLAWLLLGLLLVYRALVSALLTGVSDGGCRFTPSCSAYADAAVRGHGGVRGALLALRRVGRCHPWGGCGEDPVPPPRRRASSRRTPTPARAVPPRGGSTL